MPYHFLYPRLAFLLEPIVPHREHFINDEDIRLDFGGDGEAQARVHAA